jgi:hypothetical protein
VAATYALLAFAHASTAMVAVAMIPFGFGIGLAIGAVIDLVVLCSDPSETGPRSGSGSTACCERSAQPSARRWRSRS